LDWRTKVELYEQIRREYEFGAGSIIGVARKLGVHRRTVREAVRSALPSRRKKTERPHLKMEPAAAFIDEVLAADRKAPRKQRHTAKRIWERIRLEVPGCTAAERTVRQYVERRKQEQGFGRRETFVPQSYEFGVGVQIDWYEAYADLDGERIKLQVFSMRSMASGAAYHRAYEPVLLERVHDEDAIAKDAVTAVHPGCRIEAVIARIDGAERVIEGVIHAGERLVHLVDQLAPLQLFVIRNPAAMLAGRGELGRNPDARKGEQTGQQRGRQWEWKGHRERARVASVSVIYLRSQRQR
jgi:hypothetical protein